MSVGDDTKAAEVASPHEVTSRLAAKAAHGEELTEVEQAEMAAARAEIMNTPRALDAEAALWHGMFEETAHLKAKIETTLAKLQSKIDEAEAREAASS